jgi:hypothetical protein
MTGKLAIIYAVQRADGAVKIGVSADFGNRFARLESEFPGLRMVNAAAVPYEVSRHAEAFAHAFLWSRRIEGEWFAVPRAQASTAIGRAIDRALARHPLPDSIVRHRRSIALQAVAKSRETRALKRAHK